jgi:anti-anti-sigma regulatory factor
VVFDLSSVHVLDAYEFGQLQQLARVLRLMGVRTLVVGLSVGLVAYLAAADVDTEAIEAEHGLQEALERLMPEMRTAKT